MTVWHPKEDIIKASSFLKAPSTPARFALGQPLFIISGRARLPLNLPVQVSYLAPIRRDGAYLYFVSAAASDGTPSGVWVHEDDLGTMPVAKKQLTLKARNN